MSAKTSNTASQPVPDAAIPPVDTWLAQVPQERQRYGGLHIAAVSAQITASNTDKNCEFSAQRACELRDLAAAEGVIALTPLYAEVW